jgi:tetratricopeptide (TPR) repeat protein
MTALVLLVLMSCPVETADDSARERYAEGERFYAAGRYAEAADAYAEALEHSGKAALYFDLANTYERMGEKRRAADLLDRYLECARPDDADLVEERARRLRDAMVEPPLAQPMCEEYRPEPDGDIVIAHEDELDDDDPGEDPPQHAHPVPWLLAGGTALALAAGLALAASSADDQPSCDGCRSAGGRDWSPALQGGAALAATAGVAAATVGVVLLVRF